jgi:hypothetical protein
MACGSSPSGTNIIQIYKGGLTIGQTYLIRVDGVNANKGTFEYCITLVSEKIRNNIFDIDTQYKWVIKSK